MVKSIIDNEKVCFACKSPFNLHRHHIFYGMSQANRKKSERWGLWVYLCAAHHNASNFGVHCKNKKLDLELKKIGQTKFEELYGHEKFMEVFGENYL